MSDRTGIARGTLNPVIYFENASHFVILPVFDAGKSEQARMVYENKYKREGWEWREAGTLADVDRLQKRLISQEEQRIGGMADRHQSLREDLFRSSGSALRQQMISSGTSEWERGFIRAYLELRDSKRDKYRDSLEHHNYFLWARENDSSNRSGVEE